MNMKHHGMVGVSLLAVLVLVGAGCGTYEQSQKTQERAAAPAAGDAVSDAAPDTVSGTAAAPGDILTEAAARSIAEKTCIKGGESLAPGYHNDITRTWWFDANLNATKEGCNPACVVSDDTQQAEINWRCTGLILPR